MEHYYIYCLHNDNLPEYYVGHTKDLYQRWHVHKKDNKTSFCKVYKYIRSNGGIDNFKMEVLDEIYCDLQEAKKLERYYTELLGASLNTEVPGRTVKEYYQDNKEKSNELSKEWRINNREKAQQRDRERYIRDSVKVNCPICNVEITQHNLEKHQKTNKCNNIFISKYLTKTE